MAFSIDPTLASDPRYLDIALAKYFSSPSDVGFRCIRAILSCMGSVSHTDPPRKIIDLYYSHLARYKNNATFLGHFVQMLIPFDRHLEATYYAACLVAIEPGNYARESLAQCAALRRDSDALLAVANW